VEHSSPTVSPIPLSRGPSVFKLCVKLLPPVINRRYRVRVLRTDEERTRTSLYQEPEHPAFGINGTASNALPAFLPTPPPQQPVMTSCTIPIIYMETNGGYGMGWKQTYGDGVGTRIKSCPHAALYCIRRAKEAICYPRLTANIKIVAACPICEAYQTAMQKELLMAYLAPSRPWECVGVDIFTFRHHAK